MHGQEKWIHIGDLMGYDMFGALETGIGLQIVQGFQMMRTDLLTHLALFFHFAGTGLFYVVVIGTIYWMVDKRLGMRLLFALIIIGMLSLLSKDLFARPRPHHLVDSGIVALVVDTSYGFPSGHTSMALVFWGYFALWMQNRWISAGVVMFVILMGLSRMYVGVHFPQDVAGGLLLGGIVLLLYHRSIEAIVDRWYDQPFWIQLGSPVALAIATLLLMGQDQDGLTLAGLLIGAGAGFILETRYVHFKPNEAIFQRIVQVGFGLVITVVLLQGLDFLFDVIEPPMYTYVAGDLTVITALQTEVGVINGEAIEVCPLAYEAQLSNHLLSVCELKITPLSAILRIVRYSLVAFFAMSVIPYLSIRLNLMERETGHDHRLAVGH